MNPFEGSSLTCTYPGCYNSTSKPSVMLSLIYVSSATHLFAGQELLQLLQQSCEKNLRLDITGMLLYKDGNFMQALEGPNRAVRDLYETIAGDPRHRGVMLLLQQEVAERQFPGWSMAFRNLHQTVPGDVPGYSDFLNESLTSSSFQSDPTRAQKLLLAFRRTM
jgi:hypothetical protein